MYVAVRDAILRHAGYETIREGLTALGLSAVELAVSRDLRVPLPDSANTDVMCCTDSPHDLAACRDAYQTAGIRVSGLLLANNFNSPQVDSEIEWVAEAVRLAEGLGAQAVRIDSAMTAQQELPLAERVQIYADAATRVLEATGDCSVPLAIENHGVQGNDPEWLHGVLDAVSSDRLGLTLDTGNFYWAGHSLEDVYRYIDRFAPHARHVHCKNICFEPERRNISREPGWGYGEHVCPIPDGDVDHARVVASLRAAGYAGGLNIEDESLSKFEEDDRRLQLRRDADHLMALVG